MLHGCVEQRHQIGVHDIREVIKELQSEHLAAGSSFSDYDFLVEDEYEEIPVPNPVMDAPTMDDPLPAQDKLADDSNPPDSEAPAVPKDVKLQAVGDSSMNGDEQPPVIGVAPTQKKKITERGSRAMTPLPWIGV